MPLVAGTRLGAYEVVALIGAGGMGEVYRARDPRLGRDVAVKVLPEAFTGDADRLARFKREAQVLASLNHPHIAAIYGLEETTSGNALVLELVDGPTLADRIAKGPILVAEALATGRQIAEALEAAHERGIVHRDLKPGNIKLTAGGEVKVLDFGLARALDSSPSAAVLSQSPTLSLMATQAGVVLGTAAYMSPEQAKGLPADARSDVFAFGAVLYEMLTGRQAFTGDTAADVLANVIVRDADVSALRVNLNPRLRELVERCLEKNPKKRWQAIGDVRAEIETIALAPFVTTETQRPLPTRHSWRRVFAPVAASVVTALVFASGFYAWPRRGGEATVAKLSLSLGEGERFTNLNRQSVAISPDGSHIIYVANLRLYLRPIWDLVAKEIPGTHMPPGGAVLPAFSPDGKSVAYWSNAEEQIKRIAISGGTPVTLCPTRGPLGISWDQSGILFAEGRNVFRVSADGGKPDTLATLESGETAYGPQMLPSGDALLVTVAKGSAADRWDKARIVVQPLPTGTPTTVLEGGSDGRYVRTGHIVYALGGVLYAVPFDLARRTVTGGPVPVVEGIRRTGTGNPSATAHVSFSSNGTLVYIPGPMTTVANQRDLGLLDQKGTVEPLKLPPGWYTTPRISNDGKQITFGIEDGREASVWIYDLSGTSSMRRLTFGGQNRYPVFSADGQWVAYQSDREGDPGIFWQRADGTGAAERLTRPEQGTSHFPDVFSPAGDVLLFTGLKGSEFSAWQLSLKDRKATPLANLRSIDFISPVFSPDGKWVAYTSTETGRDQIFVQPFPTTGTKYQISRNGGHHALWSPTGNELLYDVVGGKSERVAITFNSTFSVGVPVDLLRGTLVFGAGNAVRPVDVLRDGRLLGVTDANVNPTAIPNDRIHVVLNWFEELKQRVPVH